MNRQMHSTRQLPADPELLPGSSLTAALVQPNPRDIVDTLAGFSDISLEETNKSAQMLKRIDNKYVVGRSALLSVLDELREDFKILRIDRRGIFSYKSCYFDDNGLCFKEHQQGKRQRFKVRTRLYVESDKAYFEVKLKGKRGQTDKSRQKCDHFYAYAVDDEQQKMLCELYKESYGKEFRFTMRPALHVTYNRFTLVSALGGERITIDFNLGFSTPCGKRAQIGNDFVIIETKSADGRGRSDRILKRNRIRQADGCSKYCIGMALVGEVRNFNKFRSIVKTVKSSMSGPCVRDLERGHV